MAKNATNQTSVTDAEQVETTAGDNGQQEQQAATANVSSQAQSVEELQAALARTQAALIAANHESAERRKKLKEYEQAEAEKQAAQMTEVEKLTKSLREAQQQANDAMALMKNQTVRAAIVSAASTAMFANPDDAVSMIDINQVPFDDNGQPKDIKNLVDGLAKSKPYLIKKTSPQIGATSPSGVASGDKKKSDEELLRALLG